MAAVRVLVDAPAHEMGHWVAASVLGFPWDFLHHAFVAGPNTVASTTAIALIDAAEGLFSGLVLLALAIVVPRPYRNGIIPLAAAEFAYAPFDPDVLGDAVGMATFFVALGAIAFAYVRHYWAARDEPTIVEDPVAEAARRGRFLRCLWRFEASLDGRMLTPSGVQ